MRSHHEHFRTDSDLVGSSDRGFGVVMSTALAILSWWKFEAWGQPWISWLIGAALALGLAAWLIPRGLRPLNRGWTRLGVMLGKLVTPLVLLVLFMFVFVPMGLLLRLRGFRPLRLELEPREETYWLEREPPGPDPATIVRQF